VLERLERARKNLFRRAFGGNRNQELPAAIKICEWSGARFVRFHAHPDRLRPIVPKYPGSNGIKIRQGWAWISVSGRRLLVRVPIQPDGSARAIEIAAARLCADDFAFGMSGSLYITTHPEHTLVRLDPSGARTTLAGPEQGMVGSTACAFGRARGDEKALYVTTDGGFLIPHESGIQDAKLVRMEVGESGWPLLQGV